MGKKRKPTKGKLLNLREWLTVPDAARHISNIFKEKVSEADILRLALDEHLKLSVYFVNHAHAIRGKVVSYEKKDKEVNGALFRKRINIDNDRYLNLEGEVTSIGGVWDLCMIGNERLEVENKYQNLTDGPKVTLIGLDGAFVEDEDGEIYQIQDSLAKVHIINLNQNRLNIEEEKADELLSQHKKDREEYVNERKEKNPADDYYYPAAGLPQGSVLVVRTNALMELQERLLQEESEKRKPLDIREERTYLNIIGALLEVITGKSPGLQKHPDFISQAKLIEHFCDFEMPGLSKSTLESKFAAAKRSIIADC